MTTLKTQTNPLPEAPRSATVSVTSKNGFEWLVTFREETSKELFDRMGAAETYFMTEGWTQTKKATPFAKAVQKRLDFAEDPCPKCGSRLVKGATKDGRPFVKCETQKYDFQTKRKSGCDYFQFT